MPRSRQGSAHRAGVGVGLPQYMRLVQDRPDFDPRIAHQQRRRLGRGALRCLANVHLTYWLKFSHLPAIVSMHIILAQYIFPFGEPMQRVAFGKLRRRLLGLSSASEFHPSRRSRFHRGDVGARRRCVLSQALSPLSLPNWNR